MLADRVLVLEAGRIVTEVAVALARPRNQASTAFGPLRAQLLQALGVVQPGAAEPVLTGGA